MMGITERGNPWNKRCLKHVEVPHIGEFREPTTCIGIKMRATDSLGGNATYHYTKGAALPWNPLLVSCSVINHYDTGPCWCLYHCPCIPERSMTAPPRTAMIT